MEKLEGASPERLKAALEYFHGEMGDAYDTGERVLGDIYDTLQDEVKERLKGKSPGDSVGEKKVKSNSEELDRRVNLAIDEGEETYNKGYRYRGSSGDRPDGGSRDQYVYQDSMKHLTHPDRMDHSDLTKVSPSEVISAISHLKRELNDRFSSDEKDFSNDTKRGVRSRGEEAVLLATTLFTGENDDTVKDPSKYNPRLAEESEGGVNEWREMGTPTKEDYIVANKVMTHLAEAPMKEPLDVYRGMSLPAKLVDQIVKTVSSGNSSRFDLRGISSWSDFKMAAEGFMKPKTATSTPVLLKMKTKYGTKLDNVSMYPEEVETVVGGKVNIVGVENKGSHYVLVCENAEEDGKLVKGVKRGKLIKGKKIVPVSEEIQAEITSQFDVPYPSRRKKETEKGGFCVEIVKAHKLQGRMNVEWVPISIENKQGSVRQGKSQEGVPWLTI